MTGNKPRRRRKAKETTHNKKKKGRAVPAASGGHSVSGKDLALVGGILGATAAGIVVIQTDSNKKKCISSSNDKKCKCKKDKNGKEDCEED